MARQAVLIVDDETSIRATLVKFLKSLGVEEILEAANGQEALQKLGANPQVQLIIMDLKMPVMDGLKALEQIRAVNSGVKIAILTGYPFYGEADQMVKKFGTIDFITKPVDLDYLERIISVALSQ